MRVHEFGQFKLPCVAEKGNEENSGSDWRACPVSLTSHHHWYSRCLYFRNKENETQGAIQNYIASMFQSQIQT